MIQWIKDFFKSKEEKEKILNDKIKKFCLELFRKEIEDEDINRVIPSDFYDKSMCLIKIGTINDLDEHIIRCRYNFNDGVSAIKEYCYEDVKQQMLISELNKK